MLGLSSMMLVIGLITDKRNAADSNQTKWTLDAVMIGWCAAASPAFMRQSRRLNADVSGLCNTSG